VNSYDFTNKLSGGWNTLTFNIPAALQTALAGSYSDLQFTIILNVQSGMTGTYLIDNLRFLGGTTPPPSGPDAGADSGHGCTLPAAPASVFTDPGDGLVGLAWTASTGATTYKILRTDASGASVTFTTTEISYADTSVTNGTTYTYAVAAANACGDSPSSPAVTATPTATTKITLYFPRGLSRDQVVLAANGALSINDRNKVLDAAGNPGTVSNAGSGLAYQTYATYLGAYSSIGSVSSVGSVLLRSYGAVEGKAKTGGTFTKQYGAETIEDPQENATLTPLTEFSWNVRIPAATGGPVPLEPNQERTLNPGSYTSVTVKTDAILRLSAGTYYFSDLDLESRSTIHVDKTGGPIEIYVSGNVIQRGDWIDDGGPEGDLLLVCLGTQGVSIEQVFKGTIVVPNAKLTLGSRPVPYRGTFYGKDLESHQDNVVQALPFGWDRECVQFGCLAPDLCHGAGVCDTQTKRCAEPAAKECKAKDKCHQVGTCDLDTGTCSDPPLDKIGCNVFLRMDGIVAKGDGNLIAVFGYDSTASVAVHPMTNKIQIDGVDAAIPNPPPPAFLVPSSHPGAFLATFAPGHKISWIVDTEQKSAEGPATLTAQPDGNGTSVDIGGGVLVPITPNMSPFQKSPPEPPSGSGPSYDKVFRGTISGQFAVDPSGASTYTVPIATSPGTAGMTPNLSLVYSSQAIDGIAGQGWALSGLSIIHRCPKTRLVDGHAKTVDLDGTSVGDESGDGVCLDGKRLFIKAENGNETLYETEFTDFSSISHRKYPDDSFVIVTKSGERRDYGPADGNYGHVGFPVSGDGTGPASQTVVWALTQVTDVWGNYFTATYNSDSKSVGLHVVKINYTGHQTAAAAIPPYYQISFEYEDRPDVRSARFYFASLPMTKRLKSISTPRGVYKLTYADAGSGPDATMLPSRLRQIDYCSSTVNDNECVEPLVFDWDGGRYSWVAAPEYQLPSNEAGAAVKLVDLDGDGRLDFVEAKDGSGFRAWRNTGKATGTCVSGALECGKPGGCDDGCSWNSGGSALGGSAWQSMAYWHVPVNLGQSNGDPWGTVFADLDGDGIADVITDKSNTSQLPEVYLNRIREAGASAWETPAGLSGGSILAALTALPPPTNGAAHEDPNWRKLDLTVDKVLDMDGDGRGDIVHFASSCVHQTVGCNQQGSSYHPPEFALFVLRNTGTTWTYDPAYNIDMAGSFNIKFDVDDLNRDGLPDVSGSVHKLNTGDSSSGTVWKDTTLRFNASFEPAAQLDVEGDGQPDYVGRDANGSLNVVYGAGLDWKVDLKLGGGTGSIWVPGDRTQSLGVQAKFPPTVVNDFENDQHWGKWW
jgi:hypothetical protein